ncbi:Hypothetical protein I595_1325 [Croceitalea dokdonensis DOKDO 023]|uniref:Uncharacterized protein n=1 Tax=Croceitalea dokdonensis DOKDO 023 TaxID=1300341 RepID=A0A0P7B1F9_9FLAO|nr:hypothetical protein [Croceitalea dokdonensis]KPM32898.1 Hypothetical protein I595_1325 [Croceitalea dokdonensis DOKDO 023]
MTAFTLPSPFDAFGAKEQLQKKFPNYKVKQAFLNKKALNVVDKAAMVVVIPKGDELRVIGNINIMHSWMFITFVLLLFFTLVGGLLFYGILWYTKKAEIKALEEEVSNYLKNQYETL